MYMRIKSSHKNVLYGFGSLLIWRFQIKVPSWGTVGRTICFWINSVFSRENALKTPLKNKMEFDQSSFSEANCSEIMVEALRQYTNNTERALCCANPFIRSVKRKLIAPSIVLANNSNNGCEGAVPLSTLTLSATLIKFSRAKIKMTSYSLGDEEGCRHIQTLRLSRLTSFHVGVVLYYKE